MNIKSMVGALVAAAVAGPATANLLYYNDGCDSNFYETFGDVMFCVPFNDVFAPGNFMDGTSDDIPPFNLNDNEGLVTKQGAAGGVAGGGFRLVVNPGGGAGGGGAGGGGAGGAVLVPYGSAAQAKDDAGARWQAKFKALGITPDLSVEEAREIWAAADFLGSGKTSKLVNYIGDPLVSPPPNDLSASVLDPIDPLIVSNYLMDDNVQLFFWEVEGSREMTTLDLLFGDLGLNTGYSDVLHHFPFIAVLDGVGPTDLGIAAADANMVTFNGDGLSGSGGFVGSMGIAMFDPAVVPVPASIALLAPSVAALFGFVTLARRRRRAA